MNESVINRIKRIIKRYFLEGKADKLKSEGIREIQRLIRSEGIYKEEAEAIKKLIKRTEEELFEEFSSERESSPTNFFLEEMARIIEVEKLSMSANAKRAQEKIKEAIEESLKKKEDWESAARKKLEELRLHGGHIKTEIMTLKAALDNLKRFKDFTAEEIKNLKLRYEGPEPQREFCKLLYNNVYEIGEVRRMINKFGQPALTYCGGYNCKHRWAPVFD